MEFEFLDLLPQSLEAPTTETQLLENLPSEEFSPTNKAPWMQIFMFALSLLDDALLLGLSRLGINIPWLKWLAPVIFIALSYQWIRHGYHFLKARYFSSRTAKMQG